MKTLITKLLGVLLEKLKTKNAVIFLIVQAVLVGVYSVFSQAIDLGLFPDGSIFQEALEYISLILMALIGTSTVTDLPDNYDPGNLKEVLAKILDSFKANNPRIFAVVQIVLVTIFAVLTYSGFTLGPVLDTVLQVVTLLGSILTGSRTVKFIIPEDEALELRARKTPPLEYYD